MQHDGKMYRGGVHSSPRWWEDTNDLNAHISESIETGEHKMTGQELFDRLVAVGLVNRAVWDNPTAQALYNFIASLQGSFTAEGLYEQVRTAGMFINDWTFQERSPRFRRTYYRMAEIISSM